MYFCWKTYIIFRGWKQDRELLMQVLYLLFEVGARIGTGYGTIHMPRIHIRQSQVGPRLAITICLFFEISLFYVRTFSQTG